jgi:hypothetical protein
MILEIEGVCSLRAIVVIVLVAAAAAAKVVLNLKVGFLLEQ